ncbi:hypothetical protein, partial [Frankia sp. CcWB2]
MMLSITYLLLHYVPYLLAPAGRQWCRSHAKNILLPPAGRPEGSLECYPERGSFGGVMPRRRTKVPLGLRG